MRLDTITRPDGSRSLEDLLLQFGERLDLLARLAVRCIPQTRLECETDTVAVLEGVENLRDEWRETETAIREWFEHAAAHVWDTGDLQSVLEGMVVPARAAQ